MRQIPLISRAKAQAGIGTSISFLNPASNYEIEQDATATHLDDYFSCEIPCGL